MADEFEFQAIPKYADLKSEENLNSTIFFEQISSDQHAKSPEHKLPPEYKPRPPEKAAVNEEKEPNVVADLKAASHLALFNPAASRVAEKARRRSQQPPPEEPPKESRITRTRTATAIPKLRSSSIQRKPVVADADKENTGKAKPQPPKNPEPFTRVLRSNRTSTGTTPMKPLAQPNPFPRLRSSSRCRETSTFNQQPIPKIQSGPRLRSSSIQRVPVAPADVADKENIGNAKTQPSKKPEPFTRTLRSYRTPTGTTPMKPLTQPHPFPLRSSSRCRETSTSNQQPIPKIQPGPKLRSSSIQRIQVKPSLTSTNPSPSSQRPSLRNVELNPRLRASVARLSTPRNRENIRK